MAERDFLSLLVDETLKLQQGPDELSTFEVKIKDYELEYLRGEFVPQFQIFRFQSSFGLIDIPINWSVFSQDSHFIVTPENDSDHFLEVLKASWNENLDKILVIHADGFCYLVGLKVGEDSHLHDLLNPQELLRSA